MPTASTRILNQVIDSGLSPLLLEDGFVELPSTYRSGMTSRVFSRGDQSIRQTVDVQRDKRWTKSGGRFTINVFVYCDEAQQALGWPRSTDPVADHHWTILEQLGFIATGADKWWTIDDSSDSSLIASDISRMWRTFGRPWITTCQSVESVAEWMTGHAPLLGVAMLRSHLGQRATAREKLVEYLCGKGALDESVTRWITSNGFIPPEHIAALGIAVIQRVDVRRERIEALLTPQQNS